MIRSMTGFYRTEVHQGSLSCNIEIRSVNHRYLECRIRLPHPFKCFESELANRTKSLVARGRMEIDITLEQGVLPEERYCLNSPLWQNICHLVKNAERGLGRQIHVGLSDLFHSKGLLARESAEIDPEVFQILFAKAVDEGLRGVIEMREREGQLLHGVILKHLAHMEEHVEKIEKNKQEVIDRYKQRLKKNLKQIAADYDENDPRILQEIGLFLDKCDITEEIERFRAHLTHFRGLLNGKEAVGRKLDFLLQEFNREANTICSKANHTGIARQGVELKSEIEKLREQIQNVE